MQWRCRLKLSSDSYVGPYGADAADQYVSVDASNVWDAMVNAVEQTPYTVNEVSVIDGH